MGVTVEKITDLEYNELVALNVIEKDDDLRSMFTEDVRLPFSMLYRMSKDKVLSEEIKEVIFDFFDKVISTKKNYVEKYLSVLNSDFENLVPAEVVVQVVTQEIPAVIEVATIEKPATKKTTTTKKLPKWYGKEKILEDIKNQGGVGTNPQLAALANNDLKNIYLTMNNKCINDMLTDTRKLTDEEYRTFKSAVRTIQNVLNPILKKK
jgi:translation elongation factor EF-4